MHPASKRNSLRFKKYWAQTHKKFLTHGSRAWPSLWDSWQWLSQFSPPQIESKAEKEAKFLACSFNKT